MNIGILGKTGEDKVANFLKKSGFKVLKRNYQSKFGEIDIIAENNEYILFVEVKTRKENSLVSGVDAVNFHNQQRILLTAQDFISKTECELQPRFDVAEVIVNEADPENLKFSLNYIKNAF